MFYWIKIIHIVKKVFIWMYHDRKEDMDLYIFEFCQLFVPLQNKYYWAAYEELKIKSLFFSVEHSSRLTCTTEVIWTKITRTIEKGCSLEIYNRINSKREWKKDALLCSIHLKKRKIFTAGASKKSHHISLVKYDISVKTHYSTHLGSVHPNQLYYRCKKNAKWTKYLVKNLKVRAAW